MVGSGGGGPAPFLLKTYEMVDDSSTDDIVSWSDANNSFVVWNPPEFAARLLPTYFKHNNFSSFIRQLNTYGFRKIDPERWEFSNDEFVKNQKHLLKNIHRRKPIHSHSNPPSSAGLAQSGSLDPERIALEEEIDRLSREKATLANDLWRFKQQQSGTKAQLDDLGRRLFDIEQRQAKMIDFFEKAVLNPKFVDNLIKIAGSGAADFVNLHKRRRLPALGLDYCLEAGDNSSNFYDNNGSSSNTPKHDAGQVFNQDFSDKLKLGLCPAAISDGNNILGATSSTYSSNERVEQSKINGGKLEFLSFVPDALELKDTGTSVCPMKKCSESIDDEDEMILCQLNLTLASSPMQVDKNGTASKSRGSMPGENETGHKEEGNGDREVLKNRSDVTASDLNVKSSAPAGRVNDVFWEKFLTESPGPSDTEDVTISDHGDEQIEETKNESSSMLQNRKDMEQLTL